MADIILQNIKTVNIKEDSNFIFSVPQNYLGTKAKLFITKILKSDLTRTIIFTSDFQNITTYTDNTYNFTIIVPANSIPSLSQTDLQLYNYSVQIKIYNVIDENIITISNEIYFQTIEGFTATISNLSVNPTTVTASILDVTLAYTCTNPQYSDNTSINSYEVYLLNSSKNIIYSSGRLYDWYNPTKTFRLNNLSNNTTYYVEFMATTVGGYSKLSSEYQIDISYAEITPDNTLVLTNNDFNSIKGSCVISDTTFNTYKISKAIRNTNVWKELGKSFWVKSNMTLIDNTIEFVDIYNENNITYDYKIELYNDATLVKTISNYILSKFEGLTITDGTYCYSTILKYNIYPIVKNVEANIVKVLDKKYPYIISNGETNYYSATIETTFLNNNKNKIDCTQCEFLNNYYNSQTINKNVSFTLDFMDFLVNKRPKFIKTDNGLVWIVDTITSNPQITEEDSGSYKTTFTIVQIADINESTIYNFS